MTETIIYILMMIGVGVLSGAFGSLMGLGGAMISTPFLTLVLNIDIKLAIASGLIVVIATSSGSAIAFLKDRILNIRAAMFLELFTTTGGIIGAIITGIIAPWILFIVQGVLLMFSAANMIYRTFIAKQEAKAKPNDKLAEKLKLNSEYYDKAIDKTISYKCEKIPGASLVMLFAGIISGALGVGSGPFKVIAMDNIMKIPLKVSTSTSNLMMGVTACASAGIYFAHGLILPQIAAPLAIGVICGAAIGSRIMPHIKTKTLRCILIPIIIFLGINMIAKAFGFEIGM